MASSSSSITFDDARLKRNLATMSPKVDSYVHAVVSYSADQTVAYMRSNAPWTDRTGAARSGLRAETVWVPQQLHGIDLFHTVKYGIWLEIRWAGKYAIILPTIAVRAPATMRLLSKLFAKLGKAGIS